jgi:hypothetical protein
MEGEQPPFQSTLHELDEPEAEFKSPNIKDWKQRKSKSKLFWDYGWLQASMNLQEAINKHSFRTLDNESNWNTSTDTKELRDDSKLFVSVSERESSKEGSNLK